MGIRTLLALAAVALLAPVAGAEDRVVITVPPLPWTTDPGGPEVLLLPEIRPDPAWPFEPDAGEEDRRAPGALLDLLSPEIDAAGGDLDAGEEGFRIEGPAAAAGAARDRLAAAEAFLTGRSELSVAVVALPRARTAAGIDADAVRAALSGGDAEVLWSGRFSGRRGERLAADEVRTTRFVSAVDVSAAAYAAAGAPETACVVTGTRLRLQCRPLSGEAAVVALSLQLSGPPDPLREARTGAGTVDLPEVSFLSIFTEFLVPRGGSAVAAAGNPFGEGLVAAVVTLRVLPPTPETPFDLVDLAAVIGSPDAAGAYQATGAFRRDPDAGYSPTSTARREARQEALLARLRGLGVTATPLTAAVWALSGPPEAREAARRLLTGSVAGTTLTLESRRLPWEELVRAEWFDPLTGGPPVLGPLELVPVFCAPVRAATPLLVVRGVWRRFLAGFEEDVKEGSAVVGPAVREHLEGMSILAVRRDDAILATRTTSAILGREPRVLDVRKDVNGVRTAEPDQRMDMLTTADTWSRILVPPGGAADVRREGDAAVIDRFR